MEALYLVQNDIKFFLSLIHLCNWSLYLFLDRGLCVCVAHPAGALSRVATTRGRSVCTQFLPPLVTEPRQFQLNVGRFVFLLFGIYVFILKNEQHYILLVLGGCGILNSVLVFSRSKTEVSFSGLVIALKYAKIGKVRAIRIF